MGERRSTMPSRSAAPGYDLEPWDAITPDSSRRLLLAALEAFSLRGFHAATTREIGERAGMSPAAVYVHYKSKQELLYEISRLGHEASLAAVNDALRAAPDGPSARVSAFVAAFATWHADNHVLARVIQYELKNLTPRQLRRIVEIRARFEAALRDELRRGVQVGVFVVSNLEGTLRAVLSLCIDLARWYEPTAKRQSKEVGTLYSDLVLRMLHTSD